MSGVEAAGNGFHSTGLEDYSHRAFLGIDLVGAVSHDIPKTIQWRQKAPCTHEQHVVGKESCRSVRARYRKHYGGMVLVCFVNVAV
jgi:hypothetical protein